MLISGQLLFLELFGQSEAETHSPRNFIDLFSSTVDEHGYRPLEFDSRAVLGSEIITGWNWNVSSGPDWLCQANIMVWLK